MGVERKSVYKLLEKIIKGEKGQGSMGAFIAIGSAIILGVVVFALYASISQTSVLTMNEDIEDITSAIDDATQDAINGGTEAETSAIDDDSQDKETICHIPPGKPKKARTMKVKQDAVPAHLGHGDYLGPCK